jgi:molecular chaperone DnaJ
MSKKDFYEILGVSKSANEKELKDAYRKIAMKYHPDRNPDNPEAEQKFKEAAEAYEVLSNPDKRAKYDRFGHGAFEGGGFSGGGFNMEDIFSQFGDIFGQGGSHFESFFGGNSRQESRNRGGNIRISVKLSLEDVLNGADKTLSVQKKVACKTCSGSGAENTSTAKQTCQTCKGAGRIRKVQQTFLGNFATESECPTCRGQREIILKPCKKCNGLGINQEKETVEINIPKGLEDGMSLSVRGKGNSGTNGAPAGDLIVNIQIEEHPHFIREGLNLLYNLHLNFAQLALGDKVEIPSLIGKLSISIPKGTQPGKILKVSGKGLPHYQSSQKGDLLIIVNAYTPQKLSDKDIELLEQIKASENFQPKNDTNSKTGFFNKIKDLF